METHIQNRRNGDGMARTISIGNQSFESMRQEDVFYVDKTGLIKEWWENKDVVTLITRPRRFAKTLNLDMMECFFSVAYCGRGGLFEGLSIWEEEKYHALQGQFPVISLSFAGVKATNLRGAKDGIIRAIAEAYQRHSYLKNSTVLSGNDKEKYDALWDYSNDPSSEKKMNDQFVTASVKRLSGYLEKYYGRKVLIFLDEYDTPLQEAYVSGYWSELVSFVRELFNLTFKDNKGLDRALMTGITRVSTPKASPLGKESIFSDLNNLEVVMTTSEKYEDCFGFTEKEVFQALKERGLSEAEEKVKDWYDGFCFGKRNDIYNPWSIIKFLDSGRLGPYWADTSSNALVSELLCRGTSDLKIQMEDLLAGKSLEVELDEQIVFDQLEYVEGAVWSLLMASGYLKPVQSHFDMEKGRICCQLQITNHETMLMFRNMISAWFPAKVTSYGNFKKALLQGNLKYMNRFMNEVAKVMFSSFDSGNRPSEESEPERFYHGFVLGLIVDLADSYHIRSNRESGFGRYDVVMEPKDLSKDAIIMEFKVLDEDCEKTLEDTVKSALRQIEEKGYDTELLARGIPRNHIRHYGFAFQGKKVLIGQ